MPVILEKVLDLAGSSRVSTRNDLVVVIVLALVAAIAAVEVDGRLIGLPLLPGPATATVTAAFGTDGPTASSASGTTGDRVFVPTSDSAGFT